MALGQVAKLVVLYFFSVSYLQKDTSCWFFNPSFPSPKYSSDRKNIIAKIGKTPTSTKVFGQVIEN